MEQKEERIGTVNGIDIFVKSTAEPWREGLRDGAVVLSSGLRGSMKGELATFWRNNLEDGRHLLRHIEEQLGRTTWVEPDRPVWMTIKLKLAGKLHNCNLCVATASGDYNAHPTNARRAIFAVLLEAKHRGIKHVSVPLLGAGAGRLDPGEVAERELEAITVSPGTLFEGLERFTILAQDHDFYATVLVAKKFAKGSLGEDRWFQAIKDQGKFQKISILEKLDGGYSGAQLDICELTSEHGARLPLTVFKIGPKEMIRQETQGALIARDMLGELAVEVKDTYELDSKFGALRMPLAADNSARAGMAFLRFFKESGDPREVAEALNKVFAGSSRMYEAAAIEFHKLSYIREVMEEARAGNYWSQAEEGFRRLVIDTKSAEMNGGNLVSLSHPVIETINNPFSKRASLLKALEIMVNVPIANTTHGDLNPRNIVMIKKGSKSGFVPRVLDFHRFGRRAPLAMDFARLEAGIHIKCLEHQIGSRELVGELPKYVDTVIRKIATVHGASLIGSVGADFTKAVFAIRAIRDRYKDYSSTQDERSYWMCLFFCLLNYLRPVYQERLSDEQRLFASFMAARILDRRVLHDS